MSIIHVSNLDHYPRVLLPDDVGPVPEYLSHIHYGYRWHPFRRLMYDHLRSFFPEAYILEQIQGYPHLDPLYHNIIRAQIWVSMNEIRWTAGDRWYKPRPVMETVDKGATYDIDVRDLPYCAPQLSQAVFTHLTQSFPSDIVLPQSRRYR